MSRFIVEIIKTMDFAIFCEDSYSQLKIKEKKARLRPLNAELRRVKVGIY